ncbi:RagB/SusD family nutrient uptake outer membrane protein [Maribellus luteus]|uniref:RagB/SusD family nutrient uptake outer membrane protein n=1 Tax=Maribellus luteus TaxID=2305463 RepID=A0A399T7K7_9BACT|nr:RagB/SusD family nutrient uptake outer membrane protein [Maribellus luteus]RIJ50842.1 RagB/SusD family nutrient uptake outer membrane protein [Maribellus luteus]
MKKIYIILAIVGLLSTSCEKDLLNKQPLDKFSEIDVWNDGPLAEGFVFDIYADVIGHYKNQNTDTWTDNSVPNSGSSTEQSGSIENTNDYGWNKYGIIRKCNLAIDKLSNEESTINESSRKLLLAETHLLRGMMYYWMARRFGGVMLVDNVLTAEDEMQLPRANERAVYDFIYDDISAAISGLGETAAPGRLNKAAAYAFESMVALQDADYDKVIEAADAVEEFNYSLDPVYSNMFNSYNGTLSSPEVIFVFMAGADHNNYIDTRMFANLCNVYNGEKLLETAIPQFDPDDIFNAWPERWPSQELVDAYLFNENGVVSQKAGVDFQGQPSRLMWQNRDARFEQSIVHDSAQYRNSIFTYRVGGNSHWTSNPLSTWGMSKTGYMFRKWMYEQDFFFYNYPVDWAEPIFRLGEVYLNKAEAYGRKKNIPKAIEYMNKTRTTHGGLPALDAGASEADFWKYYKIERRVEMVQEDDRYWSLIRWAKAEEANSIPELDGYKLHGLDMQWDGLVNVIESPWAVSMNFEYPKRLYFPVPDGEIRQNDKLTQNPDWN